MISREQIMAMAKILQASDDPGRVFAEFVATVLVTTGDPAGNWRNLQDHVSLAIAKYLQRSRARNDNLYRHKHH